MSIQPPDPPVPPVDFFKLLVDGAAGLAQAAQPVLVMWVFGRDGTRYGVWAKQTCDPVSGIVSSTFKIVPTPEDPHQVVS